MNYAEILFQQKIGQQDTLTYQIPENLAVKIGQAVKVKIRNRDNYGLVFQIHDQKPAFRTAPIQEIVQTKPLLNPNQVKLLKWLSDYYFCPLWKVLKLFIPKRLLQGNPVKDRSKAPSPITKSQEELTPNQKSALQTILESPKQEFLLQGITGSGKTEVYAQLAAHYIAQGQQVLILVPEISLTTQTIQYFEKVTAVPAAVIHSKLSTGERHKSWNDIHQNKAKLIIGSRSAIFAPAQDLGLIIIDEEHENSYKQDNSPRYSTHQVARQIASLSPTKILYGSATPSVETKERLTDTTLFLNERIGKSTLPEIQIVDLRDEFKKQNYSIFSESLHAAITQALEKKEQIILFLNRRGSASSVVCRDCGYSEQCPNCETALTYHGKTLQNPSLICHHCGEITTPPTTCINCHSVNIRHLGIGTQKIETEAQKAFPNARTLRADKDTTSTKNGFKEIYQAFKSYEADILIGTQMIAKGLHLPKVNLVGVILADIGLNIPDFRTNERNLQLLTQVAGRAGRSGDQGRVIIQTYSPESIALTHTKTHDFKGFFHYERQQRALLKNPPFSHLAKINIEDKSFPQAQKRAEEIENLLWQYARQSTITDTLSIASYPAYLTRLRGKYRYIVLIKDTSPENHLHSLLRQLPTKITSETTTKIDIDPISIT